MTDQFTNCFTCTLQHGPTADESELRIYNGIQVYDYRFANGAMAKFAYVGSKTALTSFRRRQLRLDDRLLGSLEKGYRSKAVQSEGEENDEFSKPEREQREVSLMLEAQFIETGSGSKFFGLSKDWHHRIPRGVEVQPGDDIVPCEAYIMLIGQHNRVRIEGARVLEEGYTEKYGEVFGHVQLIRVRVGEPAKVTMASDDGGEATFELSYDKVTKSIEARRV